MANCVAYWAGVSPPRNGKRCPLEFLSLGATVELQHATTGKGRLIISYHSLDELDGILAHIS